MFVRLKTVHGKRYVYIVEGRRVGKTVRQKVVRYLGPMSEVAFGVPRSMASLGGDLSIDWKSVNEAIARIPLTFEELSEARLLRYQTCVGTKQQGFLSSGTRERVSGEEDALVALASAKFTQTFARIGERRYRMK